jgi:hypothetical protein
MELSFNDYFTVNEYTNDDLNQDHAHQVKVICDRLTITFIATTILGSIGTIGSSLEIAKEVYFFAATTTPLMPGLVLITSLTLIALGMVCAKKVNEHNHSFPETKRASLALERLKQQLGNWPIFNDQTDLLNYRKHTDFGYQTIFNKLNDVNSPYEFVTLLYDPTKDPIPHLRIHSKLLSEEERKEILFLAFEKGIIVHFTHLEADRPSGKEYPFAAFYYECKEILSEGKTLPLFEESKKISIEFLKGFEKNSSLDFQKRVERQLSALAPKVNRSLKVDALKPLVFYRNGEIIELDINSYFRENDKSSIRETIGPRVNPIPYHIRFFHWIKG